jgi:hypothetical protein
MIITEINIWNMDNWFQTDWLDASYGRIQTHLDPYIISTSSKL